MSLELILPSSDYWASWEAAQLEFDMEGVIKLQEIGIERMQKPGRIQDASVEQCVFSSDSRPSKTYWLVQGKRFLGQVDIRPQLTEELSAFGGQVGYAIRPSARSQGFGKKILSLALDKAREMGLERVLVTCDENNIASEKIILSNGGCLHDSRPDRTRNITVLRYWINL